jgi:hypothetical protein
MPQPAVGMTSVRIMVRPVHDTAFRIPLVLAVKFDPIADLQGTNSGRQVDVVGNKYRLAGG